MKTIPENIRPPFSLIRQAISHAKFDDKETRERVVALIDSLEDELDANSFEFVLVDTIEEISALQTHLVELLTSEEEEEELSDIKRSDLSVSGGDLDDDDEDN